MAALVAPYNTSMHLGDGFNSYTQELCVDHAVLPETAPATTTGPANPIPIPAPDAVGWPVQQIIPQAVTYKTQVIDKVTDVYDSMKIKGAFDIKFGAATVNGSGDFLNSSAIKDSDISFMVTVKVVNQVYQDHTLTKFNAMPDLDTNNFTRIYGDSFISGFVEGGEFTAIISIKAKDRRQVNSITAKAKIEFTSEKVSAKVNADFNKDAHDLLNENETTISVMYTGGGQHLKEPTADWTFETMRAAALKFPMLVAHTPMRTHAILTKYDALRTFHTDPLTTKLRLPSYEKASVYTTVLQDAFVDYKTISRNLQILAFDVSSSTQVLSISPKATKPGAAPSNSPIKTPSSSLASSVDTLAKDTTPAHDSLASIPKKETENLATPKTAGNDSSTSSAGPPGSITVQQGLAPLVITEPYPPTIEGLEQARTHCRHMMNRIVAEVDAVTAHPDVAVDEKRLLPYMSPFLFKQLLPIGVPVPPVVAIEAGGNPALVSGMMSDLKV